MMFFTFTVPACPFAQPKMTAHPRPGEYFLARDTVGGKAHWARTVGDVTYHLYSISVPHDGFAIGTDLGVPREWGFQSHILECESYQDRPGWGTSTWKEECAADGGAQQGETDRGFRGLA